MGYLGTFNVGSQITFQLLNETNLIPDFLPKVQIEYTPQTGPSEILVSWSDMNNSGNNLYTYSYVATRIGHYKAYYQITFSNSTHYLDDDLDTVEPVSSSIQIPQQPLLKSVAIINGVLNDNTGQPGYSGRSGYSGISGYSGESGYSGLSGKSGWSGISGYSGYSGSGISGYSGNSTSGYSGYSGFSGPGGFSGKSGYSGLSGFSGYSGLSGYSAARGYSGYSGYSGKSGYSGYSGISGYSGRSLNIINVTYFDIIWDMAHSILIPGQRYRIVDYRTSFVIPNTQDTINSYPEPLIATAISQTELSENVDSELYPDDIIRYTVANNIIPGSDTGTILFRQDVLNNLSAYYDWRNIVYRRWFDPNTSMYSILTDNGQLYSDFYTFGNGCRNISIDSIITSGQDSPLNNISIDSECYSITIGKNCSGFVIGTNCSNIDTLSRNSNIVFESSCRIIQIGNDCSNIIFESCRSIYIDDCSNFTIPTGSYMMSLTQSSSNFITEKDLQTQPWNFNQYCGNVIIYNSNYPKPNIWSLNKFDNFTTRFPVTIQAKPGYKVGLYGMGNPSDITEDGSFMWFGTVWLDGDNYDSITLEAVQITNNNGNYIAIREKQ